MTQLEQRLIEELEKERISKEKLQNQLIEEMRMQMKELQKDFIATTQPLIKELREGIEKINNETEEEKNDIVSHLENLSLEMKMIIKFLQENSTDKKTEESLNELFKNLQIGLTSSLTNTNKDLIAEIKQSNENLVEVINQF